MENIILPVVGLLINITLIILFYSKKHVINKETNIYSKLLIVNAIFILIEILVFTSTKVINNFLLIDIFKKFYMSILVLLNYLCVKYSISIFNLNKLKSNFIKTIFKIITILFILVIFIIPLNISLLNGLDISHDVALIYSFICYVIILALTCYLIIKKNSIKKMSPFLILIVLYLLGFILRNIYSELIFEGFFYSYILLIMYHTIENPDVKMLNEVILAKNQAEKSDKAKQEFISSMSHEIRTPLNAIVGYGELIDFAETLEEAKENSKEIVASSNILLNMLSNVLDISMINVGLLELNNSKYNMNELINDIVNLFKYRLEEKNIELKLNIGLIPELYGDKEKVKRILVNLLDNAIKYTDKGTITITLKNEIKNNTCNIKISIKDTGRGIDSNTKEKLFNNFNRAIEHMNSNISGMGLGLSITKQLVELMNGKIICESQVEKGTNFIIYLTQEIYK